MQQICHKQQSLTFQGRCAPTIFKRTCWMTTNALLCPFPLHSSERFQKQLFWNTPESVVARRESITEPVLWWTYRQKDIYGQVMEERQTARQVWKLSLSMSSSSQTICKHVLLPKQCKNVFFTNNTQNIFFASCMQTSCSQAILKHVILLHKQWANIVFFSSNTRTSLCTQYAKHLLHKRYASIYFTNRKLLVRHKQYANIVFFTNNTQASSSSSSRPSEAWFLRSAFLP
jgi:hypothetical protein